MSTLAVICKAPVPGRVKTRLTPPWTPEQAAGLAEAALRDTFAAVRAARCDRRVAVLDGAPGPWLETGIEVVAQAAGTLDLRLAAAVRALGGPLVIIGMDTPQVTPALLERALELTLRHGSALGPAADGGFWAVGLRRPAPEALAGVPMSRPDTGALQLARLAALGHRPARLPELVDVDDADSARAVAHAVPRSTFAAALARLGTAVPA